jgi:hypothetical protein
MRSRTDETSLAVERPVYVGEIVMPLPSVSLDDLMARLWIYPSAPESALPMAFGVPVVAAAPAPRAGRTSSTTIRGSRSHARGRRPHQARQPRRRPTTKLAFDN